MFHSLPGKMDEKVSNFTSNTTEAPTSLEFTSNTTEPPTSLELRNQYWWATPENLQYFGEVVSQGIELLKSVNTTALFSNLEIEELGVFRSLFIFLTCIVIGIVVLYLLQCWTCVCVQKTRKSEKKHYKNLQDGFKLSVPSV